MLTVIPLSSVDGTEGHNELVMGDQKMRRAYKDVGSLLNPKVSATQNIESDTSPQE